MHPGNRGMRRGIELEVEGWRLENIVFMKKKCFKFNELILLQVEKMIYQ